jgi:hypothetical protein
MTENIIIGDRVILISKPTGCVSKDYPLTVGNTYEVVGFYGSNVITTCDEPNKVVDYWRRRVRKANGNYQA